MVSCVQNRLPRGRAPPRASLNEPHTLQHPCFPGPGALLGPQCLALQALSCSGPAGCGPGRPGFLASVAASLLGPRVVLPPVPCPGTRRPHHPGCTPSAHPSDPKQLPLSTPGARLSLSSYGDTEQPHTAPFCGLQVRRAHRTQARPTHMGPELRGWGWHTSQGSWDGFPERCGPGHPSLPTKCKANRRAYGDESVRVRARVGALERVRPNMLTLCGRALHTLWSFPCISPMSEVYIRCMSYTEISKNELLLKSVKSI